MAINVFLTITIVGGVLLAPGWYFVSTLSGEKHSSYDLGTPRTWGVLLLMLCTAGLLGLATAIACGQY